MADSQERTEQATEKRMKEVRSKGELSSSKDLPAWLSVAAATASLPGVINSAEGAFQQSWSNVVGVINNPTPKAAVEALGEGLGTVVPALVPMLVAVVLAIVAGVAVQGGIHFKTFSVSFKNFDLLKGVTRIFGTQAGWEGVKAILKTGVVGFVLYTVIQAVVPQMMNSGNQSLTEILGAGQTAVTNLIEAAVASGLVLAAADVFVVMRRNLKRTRMSKKEVKDENKSSDGDPLIKGQRRQRAFAMSRARMMAAIQTADVVVLNPTHIAVALKYEPGKSAPRVIAKGGDEIAARIREKAKEHGIPMVQDIPLARALHAVCEVGDEIPADLYNAVARVLAFVFALKARGAARGVHTLLPAPALV